MDHEIAGLLATPYWHLGAISAIERRADFVGMDRADYDRARFLYPAYFEPFPKRAVDLDALLALAPSHLSPPRVRHIFHIGYCGSTLLTLCLAALEQCMVLREPWTYFSLDRLVRSYVSVGEVEPFSSLIDLVLSTASRTFPPAKVVVVKPGSSCNQLIPRLLRSTGGQPALLLYSDLEMYLCQVLKSESRRRRISARAHELAREPQYWQPSTFDGPPPSGDARSAAFVWLWQMFNFTRALSGAWGPSLRTLNASSFLAAPVQTVAMLARHFGIGIDAETLAERLDPLMRCHAKHPAQPFDSDALQHELRRTKARHRDELADAVAWATEIRSGLPGFDPRSQRLVSNVERHD